MSQEDTDEFELRHFEKNRYFQGKLITALDMLTEQQYHAGRLSTTNKLINGSGIVSGLTLSDLEDEGDRLQVTVEPGLAIDANGRPIVVRSPTTESLPVPDGNELYIFLSYSEETKDPVPVPGSDPESGEQSEESRILEVFEIVARETAPSEYKETPQIELPDFERAEKSFTELADEIAESYHDTQRPTTESESEQSIFLGSFKKTTEGHWRPGSETKRRAFVYDNDMLFELLMTHITDTDNPHSTRVGEPNEYVENELGQIQEFAVRMQQMRSDIDTFNDELDSQREYIKHKSLKTTSRFFDSVSQEFETHGEVSRTALSIVDSAKEAIAADAYEDSESYTRFVEGLLPDAETLAETIEGVATEESYTQYRETLAEFESTIEDTPSVVELAMTLDKLAEHAEMLEQRYDVRPDE